MSAFALRPTGFLRSLALVAILAVFGSAAALAVPVSYSVTFSGATESPPNASPATGYGQVDVDITAHTMHVFASFDGLIGLVSAAHIHAPTAVAGTGNAGVATTTPTFTGFPSGVYSGTYDHTFDMTLASSFNPTYVTNNGGTPASAEVALYQAMADGKAYFNIHSSAYPGGEIRGFLTPTAVPTDQTSWGQVKTLFR